MSWLISYQKSTHSAPRLIELTTEEKLLYWLAHTGCRCVYVQIQKIELAAE